MKYGTIELHNVCGILDGDGKPGVGMSRLPLAILPEINKGAAGMARMGTGCEIRGILPPGGEAKVVLQVIDSNTTPPVITVYHGDFCSQSVMAGKEPVEIVIKPPDRLAMMQKTRRAALFDPRLVRVRLPPIHTARILSITGDLAYPDAGSTPSKTLLCYGSSITHGACAIAPEGTYAAHCARRLGCDLVNLGFGGAAQMDRAIAEHIAARQDWDLATFEMGINVRTWTIEQFRAAVETFVGTVVAAHPQKPIFCIDLFTYFNDVADTPVGAVGFRDAVRDIVAATGSSHVHHVDGRTLLTDPTGLRTDMVHPSDTGMQEIGTNLAAFITRTLN
ncbi:MAG TPA: hypothetical protein DCS43_16900 [Verrucomicrobia bacterium]|nr:hypothetical protein [Verrucomicrobiota bacterium]